VCSQFNYINSGSWSRNINSRLKLKVEGKLSLNSVEEEQFLEEGAIMAEDYGRQVFKVWLYCS